MDYVVGSVAALITGNVTPNRPKLLKRALTPTKHQASPNVTPKSEFLDDRSIFLSPSLQKKKAIVKKSPKRIFDNPDMDATNGGEGNSSLASPRADKVRKHLKDDLETDVMAKFSPKSRKSLKNKHNKSVDLKSPLQNKKNDDFVVENVQMINEITPKKKKKQQVSCDQSATIEQVIAEDIPVKSQSKKKKRKSATKLIEDNVIDNEDSNNQPDPDSSVNNDDVVQKSPKKKNRKSKIKMNTEDSEAYIEDNVEQMQAEIPETIPQKKKKNNKRKKKPQNKMETNQEEIGPSNLEATVPKKPKKKHVVNPNAITNDDSDSEHESDNEIESENEQANKEILDTGPVEESSDEEDVQKKPEKVEKDEEVSEEEVKRTLFVGNVLFSSKCKKEIKKIFNKYGTVDTVRIRTVPVKDARVTPKLAVINNELHPDRTTVNVYVKFQDPSAVEKALVENNTVLNGHHLRVSRSESVGAPHDPKCSVFVGNLPFALEDEALREKFERCGQIESVRIIRDRKTNAGKGFGYVNFASKDGVELALALSEEDLTIKNRILRVKRCTLTGNKKPQNNNKYQEKRDQSQGFNRNEGSRDRGGGGFRGRGRGGFRGRGQGFRGSDGFQGRIEGNSGRNDGSEDRNQGSRGRGQGFRGRGQGSRGRSPGERGGSQGERGRSQGERGRGQGERGRSQEGFGNKGGSGQQSNGTVDFALKRIMNKRPNQDKDEGPASKRPNSQEPREKKIRQEFVGTTAEKKKKRKVDKGQKKKKALSEILTK